MTKVQNQQPQGKTHRLSSLNRSNNNVKVPVPLQQQISDVNADLRDAVYPPKQETPLKGISTPSEGGPIRRSLNLKQHVELFQTPMEPVNAENKSDPPIKKASQTKLQRVVRAFTMDFPEVQPIPQAVNEVNTPNFENGTGTQ